MTGYFSEIWRLRYFWMALVRNDLRSRYRRSVIGIGWSLLQPIAMTAVLCVVFGRMMNQDIRTFAPYLLSGLTFWGFMTAVITQGCHCMFQGESYIRQHPAPLAIYPLRITLGAGFHFVLGLGIAIVFIWCVNIWYTKEFGNLPALVSLVPALLLLFIIGWSLSICIGIFNVLFQDSQHLVDVFMQTMFYMTPIFWYPEQLFPDRPNIAMLFSLNPFAVLLSLIREPALYGQFPSMFNIGMGALIGLLSVGVASLILWRFEKRLIFYL